MKCRNKIIRAILKGKRVQYKSKYGDKEWHDVYSLDRDLFENLYRINSNIKWKINT